MTKTSLSFKFFQQFAGLILLAGCWLLPAPGFSQQHEGGEVKDVPGLKVGERIPTFEALDQNGTRRDFNSIRGPNGAMLLFYRSADW
ncbi:MAG: hypothetical protein AB1898_24540 [Acidobacteriota bacterium]